MKKQMAQNYRIFTLVALLLFAFSLICFVGAATSQEYTLKLTKQPENEVLIAFPLNAEDRFFLDYIHSKDKTPVHDVFHISKKGKLVLIEEHYEWYGAGLAFHPGGIGQIKFENDGTRVVLNRELDQFLLRVGRIANHTLSFKSKKIPLTSIAKGGDLIEFVVDIHKDGEDN